MTLKDSYKEFFVKIFERASPATGRWAGYSLFSKEDFVFETRKGIFDKVLYLIENEGLCFLADAQILK